MAATYKILGQSVGALSDTNLYTVPTGKSSVLSTILVCNTLSASTTYRLAVIPSGTTLQNKHYIAYDTNIGSNDTTALTLGITLGSDDKLNLYGSTGLTFSVFGSELS